MKLESKLTFILTQLIIILVFLLSFNSRTNAQIEVKVNNIGSLLGVFMGVFEIPVNENFGLETELIFITNEKRIGGGILLHGKYYFDPVEGNDKFYVGMMSGGFGTEEVTAGFGFEVGYKWLGKRNVIFEMGFGGGRVTAGTTVVPYGRMMFGYRFSKRRK